MQFKKETSSVKMAFIAVIILFAIQFAASDFVYDPIDDEYYSEYRPVYSPPPLVRLFLMIFIDLRPLLNETKTFPTSTRTFST